MKRDGARFERDKSGRTIGILVHSTQEVDVHDEIASCHAKGTTGNKLDSANMISARRRLCVTFIDLSCY